MKLPEPRGPISASLVDALRTGAAPGAAGDVGDAGDATSDDDLQLALWTCYALHYRGLEGVDDGREWDVDVLALRGELERRFESDLRAMVAEPLAAVADDAAPVAQEVQRLVDAAPASDLVSFVQREADLGQFRDFMAQRSVYTRREADPSAWLLPRLDGPAKVALAELLYDEYGAGRPERLHSTLFARALEGCGLDPAYGAHVERATAQTLAVDNALSMFGLHRRLRGSGIGSLAAFEATSSVPCRRISAGAERLGLPGTVTDYFDEHVEADSVHEQVALRDICDAAVAAEPGLREDVRFGAAAYLWLEAASGRALMAAWAARSAPAEPVSA